MRGGGAAAISAILLLSVVGRTLGWNSSLVYALFGISSLVLVGDLAYRFGGERRLLAVLRARAAAVKDPPESVIVAQLS